MSKSRHRQIDGHKNQIKTECLPVQRVAVPGPVHEVIQTSLLLIFRWIEGRGWHGGGGVSRLIEILSDIYSSLLHIDINRYCSTSTLMSGTPALEARMPVM